jgi:hypothetical protein
MWVGYKPSSMQSLLAGLELLQLLALFFNDFQKTITLLYLIPVLALVVPSSFLKLLETVNKE